jgi:hypothetical protein
MKCKLLAAYALIAMFFFSCGSFKLSENGTKAAQELATLYGGNCTYGVTLSASSVKGKSKIIDIEISNSQFLNDNQNMAPMVVSNIAYTFYSLTREEQKELTFIRGAVTYPDGGKISAIYRTDTLEIVYKKMNYAKQIVESMKKHHYGEIINKIPPEIIAGGKDSTGVVEHLMKADSLAGKINGFMPMGFMFVNANNGKPVLHISGNIKGDKQLVQFGLTLNPRPGKGDIYDIQYSY